MPVRDLKLISAVRKHFSRKGREREISWAKGRNWVKLGEMPDFLMTRAKLRI